MYPGPQTHVPVPSIHSIHGTLTLPLPHHTLNDNNDMMITAAQSSCHHHCHTHLTLHDSNNDDVMTVIVWSSCHCCCPCPALFVAPILVALPLPHPLTPVMVEEAPTSFSPFSLVNCTLLSHFSFNDFITVAFPDLAEDLDIQI